MLLEVIWLTLARPELLKEIVLLAACAETTTKNLIILYSNLCFDILKS